MVRESKAKALQIYLKCTDGFKLDFTKVRRTIDERRRVEVKESEQHDGKEAGPRHGMVGLQALVHDRS